MSDHDETATAEATLARLQADIEAKRSEYTLLRESHQRLWQERKAGRLDKAGYVDFLWSEDRLGALSQELARLEPQLRLAEVTVEGLAAKRHYDSYCSTMEARAVAFGEALDATIKAAWAFTQARNEQIDPLVVLRNPDHHAAFELRDGLSMLGDLLAALPNTSALVKDWLVWSVLTKHGDEGQVGLTRGNLKALISQATGTTAFPAGEIARYLAPFEAQVQEDKPLEDL